MVLSCRMFDSESQVAHVPVEPQRPQLSRMASSPSPPRPVRIVTWNIGLRGLKNTVPLFGSVAAMIRALGADVLCLQETKLTPRELTDELALAPDYSSYFSFARQGVGYSGTATFCHKSLTPVKAQEGLTGALWTGPDEARVLPPIEVEPLSCPEDGLFLTALDLDGEGRCVITDHGAFVLFNIYFPSSRCGARHEFKMRYHWLVTRRCRELMEAGRHVIVAGDVNCVHMAQDHCDPEEWVRETGSPFDCSPIRWWMDDLLGVSRSLPSLASSGDSNGDGAATRQSNESPVDPKLRMVDAFRHWFPAREKAFTCWNAATSARKTNYGTRIDYILVDHTWLAESKAVSFCDLMQEFEGSDHCPVYADIKLPAAAEPAPPIPPFSANHLFVAKQSSLKRYFSDAGQASAAPPVTPGSLAASQTVAVDGRGGSAKKPRNGVSQMSVKSFFMSTAPVVSSAVTQAAPATNATVIAAACTAVANPGGAAAATAAAAETDSVAWKSLLAGPLAPPMCSHGEVTVERTVLKDGPNKGKVFYVCARPDGKKGDPNARCNFFLWASEHRKRTSKAK